MAGRPAEPRSHTRLERLIIDRLTTPASGFSYKASPSISQVFGHDLNRVACCLGRPGNFILNERATPAALIWIEQVHQSRTDSKARENADTFVEVHSTPLSLLFLGPILWCHDTDNKGRKPFPIGSREYPVPVQSQDTAFSTDAAHANRPCSHRGDAIVG